MRQNEEKIELNHLIAIMALNGIYDKYLMEKNKDSLCEDMHSLIEFCISNNLVKNNILVDAINKVILSEDLISWEKERQTNE